MKGKTEADNFVQACSDGAESIEMARKNQEQKAKDDQQLKEEAIAAIYEMAGKIKATHFFKEQAGFFDLLLLKQVKDSKEYRNRLGMTWDQFCESIGVKRRTIDLHLEDLQPFRVEFLASFRQFSGVDVGKIKYLGMAVDQKLATLAENAIIYNGETIPLDVEHKDDIQALLEKLEESLKQQTEDHAATLKAKDRLLKSKDDLVNKMEREIHRLEKKVDLEPLSAEEQEAVDLLRKVQGDFIEALSTIKKKIPVDKAPEIALRQLYFLYVFISKVCMDERLALHEYYKDAIETPWEIMEEEIPEPDVLLENMPLGGKKLAGNYRKKIEQRQTKKSAKPEGE